MNNSEIEALSRDSDFNLFVLRRWRDYLNAARDRKDPVFAAWNAFARILSDDWSAQSGQVLQNLPPDSNAELTKAFVANPPKSMDDVAKIYGELLAKSDGLHANPDPAVESLRLVLRAPGAPANVPLEDFIEIRGGGGDDNILRALEGDIRDWEAQFGYRGITPRAMASENPPSLFRRTSLFAAIRIIQESKHRPIFSPRCRPRRSPSRTAADVSIWPMRSPIGTTRLPRASS